MESEVVASVADTDEVYTFRESRVYYSVMRLPCKRSRLCGKNSSPSSLKKDAVPFVSNTKKQSNILHVVKRYAFP